MKKKQAAPTATRVPINESFVIRDQIRKLHDLSNKQGAKSIITLLVDLLDQALESPDDPKVRFNARITITALNVGGLTNTRKESSE